MFFVFCGLIDYNWCCTVCRACVNGTVVLASSSWDFVRVCCYKLGWSGLDCVGAYVWLGGGGLWPVVLQKGVKNCIGEYCVFII